MNLLASFLLGLAGSLHCAAMCGPLLLAVGAARRQAARARGGAAGSNEFVYSILYHSGRLGVYLCLGALSGLLGAAVAFAGFQRWISIAAGVLVLAAVLISWRSRWGGWLGRAVLMFKRQFGAWAGRCDVTGALMLGGLNGLLPCGLVYAACAVAAAGGTMGAGMASMLAFGAGTLPLLLGMSLAGKAAGWLKVWRPRGVVSICAALVGLLLVTRGLALGIPYLSPGIVDGKAPSCCQRLP